MWQLRFKDYHGNSRVWWTFDLFVYRVFCSLLSLGCRGNVVASFCSITFRWKWVLLNRVHPVVAKGSWRKPTSSQQEVIRMSIESMAIMRSNSWTKQGLQQAFSLRTLTQWYSTNWTCGMLLQPYVYASNMEGVTTIGKNSQRIFTMVFWEANCASAKREKYF